MPEQCDIKSESAAHRPWGRLDLALVLGLIREGQGLFIVDPFPRLPGETALGCLVEHETGVQSPATIPGLEAAGAVYHGDGRGDP